MANLNLINDVESVSIASIGEYDSVKGICQTIRSGLTFKGVLEILSWIVHICVSTEDYKTSDCNEDKSN